MSDLTLAAAVDRSPAATAHLEFHMAGRLVQLVELAGGVAASDEHPGQLHVHSVIHSQGKLRHAHALIKKELDEEVDKGHSHAIPASAFSRHVCRSIQATR